MENIRWPGTIDEILEELGTAVWIGILHKVETLN
jgi:hypothetical protein